MITTTLYEILGIPDTAGIEEVKAAFRKLALVHHPDKNSNSPESQAMFILIHDAYQVLSDPDKRKEYDRGVTARKVSGRKLKTALPYAAGAPLRSLDAILSHLNTLLWDIEDFLLKYRTLDWKRKISGKPCLQVILDILVFIDKWILEPSGERDFFADARQMERTDIRDGMYHIFIDGPLPGHRPYVSIGDYFYNIRKRADSFMKHAKLPDLIRPLAGSSIRIIDCVIEAQNMSMQALYFLELALSGMIGEIPDFIHSNPVFGR